MKTYSIFQAAFGLMLTLLFCSCEDFVDVPVPTSQLSSGSVYQNDATASAAMYGVYIQMMSSASYFASGGAGSVTVLAGLSADELENQSSSAATAGFYGNALDRYNTDNLRLWQQAYKTIYYVNAVLEGLQGASAVSEPLKNQLTGEALFLRAFCHFYLVNLYGDVPLALSTDYLVNKDAQRTSAELVYAQIITDLKKAKTLLVNGYEVENGQRIRPNAAAVSALLARIYIYQQNWEQAAASASEVIDQTGQYGLVGTDSVFLKNSREAIWQLMPVSTVMNTYEGNIFVLTAKPNAVSLSSRLVLELGSSDRRKAWVGSLAVGAVNYYYPFKYKVKNGTPVSEYSSVLRLAEQYLIRSEAYAHQNLNSQAVADLDKIRQRAGLPLLAAQSAGMDSEAILAQVQTQRRLELFCEWGHRWFDLKRTNMAKEALEKNKAISWQNTDALYPIPDSEMQLNPKLSQNPGYQ